MKTLSNYLVKKVSISKDIVPLSSEDLVLLISKTIILLIS